MENSIQELVTRLRAGTVDSDAVRQQELTDDIYDLIGILELALKHNGHYEGYFLENMKTQLCYEQQEAAIVQPCGCDVQLIINPGLFCAYKVREMLKLLCSLVHRLFEQHGDNDTVCDDDSMNDVFLKTGDGTDDNDDSMDSDEDLSEDACTEKADLLEELDETDNDLDEVAFQNLIQKSIAAIPDEEQKLLPDTLLAAVCTQEEPPQISWKQILRQFIGTIPCRKRSTRTRLSRRQPERFDLSGKITDQICKLVVAIDTSGSMEDEMIEQIFNEIFGIMSARRFELTVIECDAQIQRVYRARYRKDIQPVKGRGSTSFTPVIRYINSDRYYRDAVLIYFTDGYGEYKIPRPLTSRNLWVIIGDEANLTLREPFGMVVSMEKK